MNGVGIDLLCRESCLLPGFSREESFYHRPIEMLLYWRATGGCGD